MTPQLADNMHSVILDSGARVVLCLTSFKDKVERSLGVEHPNFIVAVDAFDTLWRKGDTRSPTVHIEPDDGAYVIYT